MSTSQELCASSPIFTPALPMNNTGACIALYTDKTLNLMKSCCPTAVYTVNTTVTTGGEVECEYLQCDITGYSNWSEAAACFDNSVIVEDHAELQEIEEDTQRGCAFNASGVASAALATSGAGSKRPSRGMVRLWTITGVLCGLIALL